MLREIACPRFRGKPVQFGPGLNVVLGDSQASNSIGKSTLLMLVDFAHGGGDLLKRSTEVVLNLGDHEYQFTFLFQGSKYVFSRHTARPNSVRAISVGATEPCDWSILDYAAWLKQQYGVEGSHVSFRQVVSPQTRVWKRETLDPDHPLQTHSGEAQAKAIKRFLMLFGAYDALNELELRVDSVKSTKKSLADAQKAKFITSINQKEYRQNEASLRRADAEIERIRENASTLALNIQDLFNEQTLEATIEKDRLLKVRLQLLARRQRTVMNLDGVGAPKRRAFEALVEFFPQLDLERLASVEGFHRKLARVLKHELEQERATLDEQLELTDGCIADLDGRILPATRHVPSSSFLVDRVVAIAADAHKRRQANEFYDKKREIGSELRELNEVLNRRRTAQLNRIQDATNDYIRDLAGDVFPPGRRPPRLHLAFSKYLYDVDQDTGTGTTFAALVLLDLALLQLTPLPFVVHDSVLLKNIEVPVMAALVRSYLAVRPAKQIFIAIDEAQKYGVETQQALVKHAVIQLSASELLYDFDWRSEDS